MTDTEAALARKAADAMMEGDIGPMAKWLRIQRGRNALLLAEAIERGSLTYKIPHPEKTYARKMQCGKWIVEQVQTGMTTKSAISRAAELFGMSKREAERAKSHWLEMGADQLLALKRLAGDTNE